jgi:hypothetical protein
MNMKSYGNHNAAYDARIIQMQPEYVIDNPAHGLYGEMDHQENGVAYEELDYLLQDVAGYQAAGIKVIGYITAGYEGGVGEDTGGDGYDPYWYSLELNKMLIRNMAELDGVDGVFIDECSSYPKAASKAYLKQLTDLAHSLGLITWGNVGVDDFDEWFFTQGGFDLMQSSEAWQGQSLSPVQKKWGQRISVTGFNRTYTARDAYDLTIDAWQKGIAYCYINTVEYVNIAPWFEDYVDRLREYQEDTPQNHAPVLSTIGSKTVALGKLLQFTISATDPDQDALTYSASRLPPGATFNPATRAFRWTPGPKQSGTYKNVRFKVSDGQLTDFENIAIRVGEGFRPDPSFSVRPAKPKVGEVVTLTAKPGQDSYTWLINGSIRKTGRIIKHTFKSPGDKPMTLKVTLAGKTAKKSQTISVKARSGQISQSSSEPAGR